MDAFAFKIPINFEKKEDSINTLTGGVLSIIYFISFIGYFSFCFYKMINHMQDS